MYSINFLSNRGIPSVGTKPLLGQQLGHIMPKAIRFFKPTA